MLEFKSWRDFERFQSEVHNKWRFIRSPEQEEFLRTVLVTSQSRITKLGAGMLLWRAQPGHDWRNESSGDPELEIMVPAAHPPSRMKPPPNRAPDGRANPKGIPYLYLATTRETAMSEVRPWIGSSISVASFRVSKDLRIIDCSRYHKEFAYYIQEEEPSAAEREKAVWTHIDRAFSRPVERSDDSADYMPTQIIAELFKREGFDGIAYKSAFGEDGYNVVLFDLDSAEVHSGHLFDVKSVNFQFEESDNPYFIKKDEKDKA